jgi:SpoVK/Ycf46/Vps4 family AAA+-type ATPase
MSSVITSEHSGSEVVVTDVVRLEKGVRFKLTPFQVMSHDQDGNVNAITMQVDSKKESVDYEIKPGAFRLTPKAGLQRIDFPDTPYFKTPQSEELRKIFTNFRNKIHVYVRAKLELKRSALLGSEPGVGKTSLITDFCKEAILKDPSTCALFVDSEEVSPEILHRMFRTQTESSKDVKFIILVIEDIGGTGLNQKMDRVSGELLSFLEGSPGLFTKQTLIVGTTNYLDDLSETLKGRPGRFDVTIQITPPDDSSCKILAQNYSSLIKERDLTGEEIGFIIGKKFTPAYIKEIILRSELNDISIQESVKELEIQRKKSDKKEHGINDRTSDSKVGFGFNDDDDDF